MKPNPRPPDPAPGGMGGMQRMLDPSEHAHDRVRRRLMNIAFLLLLIATAVIVWTRDIRGTDILIGVVMMVAGVPLGLGVKTVELRFKMAADEWARVLGELPRRRRTELLATAGLILGAMVMLPVGLVALLWGAWGYDFVTYYHDRPQRLRHIYNVVMILDELRRFPWPWLWPLPALLCGLWWSVRGG
ncbi:MAG: hypothetical protein NZ483_10985 [Verrucomicrobiae bacterium]|nr:hypothetical protein [Verrucomicrobiae bacterium]MDW8344316.1 hypothetical protein [Verrucomicrobiae bacterium]